MREPTFYNTVEKQKRENEKSCQEIEDLIKQDMAEYSGNTKTKAIINGLIGASHSAVILGNTFLADMLLEKADRLQIYVPERVNERKKK